MNNDSDDEDYGYDDLNKAAAAAADDDAIRGRRGAQGLIFCLLARIDIFLDAFFPPGRPIYFWTFSVQFFFYAPLFLHILFVCARGGGGGGG